MNTSYHTSRKPPLADYYPIPSHRKPSPTLSSATYSKSPIKNSTIIEVEKEISKLK